MKSIQAEYDESTQKISIKAGAKAEPWVDICKKFNDDVSRVCDAKDLKGYTGLFECFDDNNKRSFYLVNEDKNLYRMKHKRFLDNLGLE